MPPHNAGKGMVAVEITFANATSYEIISLQVAPGTTIQQVIDQSNILEIFPELRLQTPFEHSVGIFGLLKSLDTVVVEGDRVEIYRALSQKPMDARKERVKKAKILKE